MKLKDIANKMKKAVKNTNTYAYDMSTKEAREKQVLDDFTFAKEHRGNQDRKWIELDNYYHNRHKTNYISKMMAYNEEIPFELPTLTEAFIHVESQIDPVVPDFQFRGRDADFDPTRVKEREDIVNYVCYNNRLERLNVSNERYLNKLGNAFWKVAWDKDIKGAGFIGDIVIGNPMPNNIFPDPSAFELEDCEYIIYVYRIHRRAARRKWKEVIDNLPGSASHHDTEIFEDRHRSIDDETLQVIEYWYRDHEGDIACSIQVENVEVQFIEKFWEKTKESGNQMYPFIKYCKIPLDHSFWDLSEIESIKDLIDAGDIEFLNALLNDMLMGNDAIIYEEGALQEGYEIKGLPSEKIPVNRNMIDKVRRLGGVSNNANAMNMLEFIRTKAQETTGNASTNDGIEPLRVTTASGIAQMNEKSEARKNIKKFDRLKGFEELFKLLDFMALEFYDDNRTIIIRGQKKEEEDRAMVVNSQNYMMQGANGVPYYPSIDVEVTAGDGINKSKSFTMQVMTELIGMPITPQNEPLVEALIDILELPNAEELKQMIRSGVQMMQQQAMMAAQGNSPQNNPQVTENGGQDMVDQVIDSMSPEELNIFKSKSPEEQIDIIKQLAGGQLNG